jgi:recombination associated protein RdgC
MSGLWLKAITCLNLTGFPNMTAEALAEKLEAQRFTPCSSLERERHGFTPAFEQESLVRKVKDVFWLQIMSEVKPVPGSVVKRLLRERITKVEKEEGRKVGRKEQKELKEDVIDELVAKAVPVQSTMTIMLDTKAGLMVISSTSNKKVELALSLLGRCLDNLNASRMQFAKTIPGQMSELLLDEDTSIFVTDSSLVLKGPGSPAATVRFAQHSLAGPEIITHLNAGLRPVALELAWKERMSFVLSENFEIKNINFLELVTSEFENAKPEDPEELIDAMLMIQTGELREMVAELTAWLGGAAEDAVPATPAAVPSPAPEPVAA